MEPHDALAVGAAEDDDGRVGDLLEAFGDGQAGAGLVKGGGEADDLGAQGGEAFDGAFDKSGAGGAGAIDAGEDVGRRNGAQDIVGEFVRRGDLSREQEIGEEPLAGHGFGRDVVTEVLVDLAADSGGEIEIQILDASGADPGQFGLQQADTDGRSRYVSERHDGKYDIHGFSARVQVMRSCRRAMFRIRRIRHRMSRLRPRCNCRVRRCIRNMVRTGRYKCSSSG